MSVHKNPASLQPENAVYNHAVANIRVQSEHCMGALKGWFQCLQGLHVDINSNANHVEACRWIPISIIIHNMVIDIEGMNSDASFGNLHNWTEELEDGGIPVPYEVDDDEMEQVGEIKCHRLVAEIVTYKIM